MFIPSRLSILLGSAALVALPGLTMAADVTAVEFSSTPAPATDEAMLRPVTSSVAKVTYADGTKLEMTTPADSGDSSGSSTGSGNPNSFNFGNLLKMMVNLQAQLTSSTSTMNLSV